MCRRRSPCTRLCCLGVAVLALVLALALTRRSVAAAAAQPANTLVRLSGQTLSRLGAPVNDTLHDGDPLTLTVVLNRTDQAGFDAFLQALQDPRSPGYQHFLSQTAIADRCGPSISAYARVRDWLQGEGFSLVAGSDNRLTLTVRGTRAQAERALSVAIHDYRVDGQTFYANDRDPALPASLAKDVQSVVGLEDRAQPTRARALSNYFFNPIPNPDPQTLAYSCFLVNNIYTNALLDQVSLNVPGGSFLPLTATDLLNYLCAADELNLVAAYAGSVGHAPPLAAAPAASTGPTAAVVPSQAASHAGTGQKIGLLEFDNFHVSDVQDYLNLMQPGASIGQLSQVHVAGGAGTPGADESEVLVDVDTAMTLAPGAQVVVYDGPFTGQGSFQMMLNAMVNDHDTVISNSWAYCEDQTTQADVQGLDSIVANAEAGGVTVVSGSGDHGNTCLDGASGTIAVPADLPHVTAVGGTTPTKGRGGTYGSESWWNGTAGTPPTGAGGFGTSRFFSRPSYQDGLSSDAMRSIPDVTAPADPAHGYIICQADAGGCPAPLLVGGTSVSAPIWGAFIAAINQASGHNQGYLNPLIYPQAATRSFHGPASIGSDFAHVGLGSPNVDALYLALSSRTLGPVSTAVSVLRAFPQQVVDDGVSPAAVGVAVMDANGNTIPGQTVALNTNAGSHAVITAVNNVSSADNGVALFTVTDTAIESVTLSATIGGAPLGQSVTVQFVSPAAAAGGIVANPTTVAPNGTAFTTITVTLQDAAGHGVPGKTVTLSQGSGHSSIAGPTPTTTDANGQVTFKATDTTAESVTYTAVDVTDGNLAIPGAATVTFFNGVDCHLALGTPAGGYAVTTFASGFPLDVNNFGCLSPIGLAFDGNGNLLVMSPVDDTLYKFGPKGGVAGPATQVGAPIPNTTNGNTNGLTFGKDGRLYATQEGGFEGVGGRVVELDPQTAAVVRQVAAQPGFGLSDCDIGIATDPLSGDLFTSQPRCTLLGGEPTIGRISAPAGANPVLSQYARPGIADGLTFGPDGTLYAAVGNELMSLTGTNTANPGTVTDLATVPTLDGVAVQQNPANPAKPFLIANRNDGTITKVDLTTTPATLTDIYTGGSRGDFVAVGPDGCLYATQTDRIIKVTNADGSCSFSVTGVTPSLTLAPSSVSPSPAQGSTTTFTAKLNNVSSPAGTVIRFFVSGTNGDVGLAYAAADGTASFSYAGKLAGTDVVIAQAQAAGGTLTSNVGTVTWTPGKHATFASLNPSPTAGSEGASVTLVGTLTDISLSTPAPIAGATLTLGVGGVNCTATTGADGSGSCAITLTMAAGSFALAEAFAGTSLYLPSADNARFLVNAAVQATGTAPTKSCTVTSPAVGSATACTLTTTAPLPVNGTLTDTVDGPQGATITSCGATTGGLTCGTPAGKTVTVSCTSSAGCDKGATVQLVITATASGSLAETVALTPPIGGPPQSFPVLPATPVSFVAASGGGGGSAGPPTKSCTAPVAITVLVTAPVPLPSNSQQTTCTLTTTTTLPAGGSVVDTVTSPSPATITGCNAPGGGLGCGALQGNTVTVTCNAAGGCQAPATFTVTIATPALGQLSETVAVTPPGGGGASAFTVAPNPPVVFGSALGGTITLPPSLSISVNGCGSTIPAAGGYFLTPGQSLSIAAVPCDSAHVFTGWSGSGTPCDGTTQNPCVVTFPPTTTITANFAPTSP